MTDGSPGGTFQDPEVRWRLATMATMTICLVGFLFAAYARSISFTVMFGAGFIFIKYALEVGDGMFEGADSNV